jgi:hypothetical protein
LDEDQDGMLMEQGHCKAKKDDDDGGGDNDDGNSNDGNKSNAAGLMALSRTIMPVLAALGTFLYLD